MRFALAPDLRSSVVTVTATAAAQRVQLRLIDLRQATDDLVGAVLRMIGGESVVRFSWPDATGRSDWTLEHAGTRVHVHITAAGRSGRGDAPAWSGPLDGELLQSDEPFAELALQLLAFIGAVEQRLGIPGALLTPAQRETLLAATRA